MWENFDVIKGHNHLLRQRDFHRVELVPVGRDLLARRSGRSISFIRVPRISAGRQEVKEWRVGPPATPFRPSAFTVYPPEKILVLIEWRKP